jgi:replication initiation protein RepC
METHLSTTPFGRRTLSLAHVASQTIAKARPPEKAVHKWKIFHAICAAKARIGVSERALAVLDALLSFHPETVLTGQGLIVFPSNQQLALRAHGMAPATLRRHLAALVDRGLIIRRDSPNGKRYARKGQGGDIAIAFGFDLAPLVARAEEFEEWAEEVAREDRALKLVRERITLCRRDIAKMIATGVEESVSLIGLAPSLLDWPAVHLQFRAILTRLERTAPRAALEAVAGELSLLADRLFNLLEIHIKNKNLSGNESQFERHKQNSNPKHPTELEPASQKSRVENPQLPITGSGKAAEIFPLGMVMEACPDMADYTNGEIRTWRDFQVVAALVRPMLGISPSAWEEARTVMGENQAAVVVAAIMQRGPAINSAGGYLRGLTEKARVGAFSTGPMLMALIGNRKREKRSA